MKKPRFRIRFSQLEVGTFVLTRLPAYVAIGIVAFLLISALLLLVYLGIEFDSPVLHLVVRAGDFFI